MDNNIQFMRTEPPLLAPIFRSEGQARVLALILLTDEELSLADIASRTGIAYPTVHREVSRLLLAGIIVERQQGRSRLIRANSDSPLVAPLREIAMVAMGPPVLLEEEFSQIGGIDHAFIYGSFAARMDGMNGPTPNDIDVMVIGEPSVECIYEACDRVEQKVHRPVNVTVLSRAEADRESGFLSQVREGPKVVIVGGEPWNRGR